MKNGMLVLILIILVMMGAGARADKLEDAIELVNGRILSDDGFQSSGTELITWVFATNGEVWNWDRVNTTSGHLYRIVVIDMGPVPGGTP